MPVKKEKLEQVIKKLLKETTDHSNLTVRTVKRSIEEELGLETGDLDTQTEMVKEILLSVVDEQDEPGPTTTTTTEKTSTKRKAEEKEDEEEQSEEQEKEKEVKEEEEGEEEEEEEKPKAKKAKPTAGKKAKIEKKEKKGESANGQEDADGQLYFELNDFKRITIKEWKNQKHVDLRVFYRKDGELAPTPKGLMLTKQQWQSLKDSIPEIDKLLKKK